MENANCLNTLGSYICVCASGYTGDGFSSCVRDEQSKKALIIGLTVAIAGLVLIATAVIIITLVAYLMKRNKPISKAAYVVAGDLDPAINTSTYEAYALSSTINETYYNTATTLSAHDDIMTTTNEAYVATDIPTSPNKAYQTALCSSATNPLTYDYVYDYIHPTS